MNKRKKGQRDREWLASPRSPETSELNDKRKQPQEDLEAEDPRHRVQ